jgi:hypothetical protein
VSANKYTPHLIVIPEDQAVREIVNGFSTCLDANERQFSVYDLARGWERGKEILLDLSKGYMREYPHSYAILIVDFDRNAHRGSEIKNQVPEGVRDRVFVVGVLNEPEDLKESTGMKFEELGRQIAGGCKDSSIDFWKGQELLAHNVDEIRRLSGAIRDLFFR